MDIAGWLNAQKINFHAGVAFLVSLIIGFIDYWTGIEFRLQIFYLLPILYVTWFIGKNAGIAASIWAVFLIFYAVHLVGKEYPAPYIEIWNLTMYFVFFLVTALLLGKLQAILRQRAEAITKLEAALHEVKELRGILPICANCKKIRDDEGYWQDVAVYISKRTNAEFSHGLCKDCAQKLYPAYYDKKKK